MHELVQIICTTSSISNWVTIFLHQYIVHWFFGEKYSENISNILLYNLHIVSEIRNSADLLHFQNNLQYHIDRLVLEKLNSSGVTSFLH